MQTYRAKHADAGTTGKAAKILSFTPRPAPEVRTPTLLDVLERQLFDDANP